jgi:hypothetical protein
VASDDRFAEAWRDIPDPIAPADPPQASRPQTRPSADPPQASRPQTRPSSVRPVQLPEGASPTRSAMKTRRAIAVVALTAWPPVLRLGWGFRPDIAERSAFVAGQAALLGLLLIPAILIAILPGRRGLGGPLWRTRIAALGLPIAFMLVGLFWLPEGSPGSFGEIGPWAAILPCFSIGLLVAVPMLLVLLWAVQRAFPSAAAWRGGALGAAVGLVGSAVLTAHCSSPFGGHVALAHGLPIVIAGLLGGFLGLKIARA